MHSHRVEYLVCEPFHLLDAPPTGAARAAAIAERAHREGLSLREAIGLVVGYLDQLEPMDLHAWFEAYVGGRWYTFDATQSELRGGYVAVGYGRDAADVAVYSQFGPAVYPTAQTVKVERLRR